MGCKGENNNFCSLLPKPSVSQTGDREEFLEDRKVLKLASCSHIHKLLPMAGKSCQEMLKFREAHRKLNIGSCILSQAKGVVSKTFLGA